MSEQSPGSQEGKTLGMSEGWSSAPRRRREEVTAAGCGGGGQRRMETGRWGPPDRRPCSALPGPVPSLERARPLTGPRESLPTVPGAAAMQSCMLTMT